MLSLKDPVNPISLGPCASYLLKTLCILSLQDPVHSASSVPCASYLCRTLSILSLQDSVHLISSVHNEVLQLISLMILGLAPSEDHATYHSTRKGSQFKIQSMVEHATFTR